MGADKYRRESERNQATEYVTAIFFLSSQSVTATLAERLPPHRRHFGSKQQQCSNRTSFLPPSS